MSLRYLWVSLLLACTTLGFGQSPNLTEPDTALRHFVESAEREDWDAAALAIAGLTAPIDEDDQFKVQELKEVLRVLGIHADDLPFGDSSTRVVLGRVRNDLGAVVGTIAMASTPEGTWVFDADTWANIDALYSTLVRVTDIAAPDIPEDASPPEALSSPRSALSTFLVSMNNEEIGSAVQALDLSSISSVVRETEGPRLAQLLLAILNRTEYVRLESIPNEVEGDPYVVRAYVKPSSGQIVGRVILARQDDGAWRIASQSIDDLPAIWEMVKDRPVMEGLKDVDQSAIDPATWLKNKFPTSTHSPALGLGIWQWISLGGLIVAALTFAFITWTIIWFFVRRFVTKDHATTRTRIRWAGLSLVASFTAGFMVGGLPYLGLPEGLLITLTLIVRLTGIVTFTIFLATAWEIGLTAWVRKSPWSNQRSENLVVPLLSRLGKATLAIAALVAVVALLGVNVAGLLAGLGIGGLVFALAAKDSVENLFGSVTVLVENPFQIGDWVRVNGVDGTVEEINLRSTRIRTMDDSLVTLPNSQLITAAVENMGRRRARRCKTALGLSYSTPPTKINEFCERVRTLLEEHPSVLDEKRNVFFNDFGESTLDVLLSFFIIAENWTDELSARDEIMRGIVTIAAELGVEFAFPTRTVIQQSADPMPAVGIE
ncbi:MAG: mechanosensitive ion channel family protein [Fimbriimonadaceae bacterium]|nr:mechanosensitive ion channel family protein [Fimbriimonadaceae bacterium]